jgi:hypothetical protein
MNYYKKWILVVILVIFYGACSKKDDYINLAPGFKLWQLPTHSNNVMNSYIMTTPNELIIVFDGGDVDEAENLYSFLKKHKGHISAWFISHQHKDHNGALTEILTNPKYRDLRIDAIYGSFLSEEEIFLHEPNSLDNARNLNLAISKSNKEFIDLNLGDKIVFDSIAFQVLSVKNPEIHRNFINNSSVVLRVSDNDGISILFTGDLGTQGGDKVLATKGVFLKSVYVQMSHHGSHGVNKDFYEAVNPEYCLWPTPKWLWDNDDGKGYNSGTFTTIEVKGWMDELGVKKHYVMFDGLVQVF